MFTKENKSYKRVNTNVFIIINSHMKTVGLDSNRPDFSLHLPRTSKEVCVQRRPVFWENTLPLTHNRRFLNRGDWLRWEPLMECSEFMPIKTILSQALVKGQGMVHGRISMFTCQEEINHYTFTTEECRQTLSVFRTAVNLTEEG